MFWKITGTFFPFFFFFGKGFTYELFLALLDFLDLLKAF